MFSWHQTKKQQEVQQLLSRINNVTQPNQSPFAGEYRGETRSNRSLPVLLCPWENDEACVDECATAVTKDISSTGVSFILRQPIRAADLAIGFWLAAHDEPIETTDPVFVMGEVRQYAEIGGGYWQIGVKLVERLDNEFQQQIQRLKPIAARLVPPGELKRMAPSQMH